MREIHFCIIAFMNNEAQFYDVLSLTGFIFSTGPIGNVETSDRKLLFRKVSLSDSISITIFGELVHQLKMRSTLSITDLRVSKYETTKRLKINSLNAKVAIL